MPAPIVASPLKVRTRKRGKLLAAEGPDGQVVIEGHRDGAASLLETAGGTWRVEPHRRGGSNADVLDAHGTVVATITRRMLRGGEIALASGETIPVSPARVSLRHGCRFGELANARAPYLFPQRYFTLSLSDQLLARDDRELIVALAAHLADTEISAAIAANQATTS